MNMPIITIYTISSMQYPTFSAISIQKMIASSRSTFRWMGSMRYSLQTTRMNTAAVASVAGWSGSLSRVGCASSSQTSVPGRDWTSLRLATDRTPMTEILWWYVPREAPSHPTLTPRQLVCGLYSLQEKRQAILQPGASLSRSWMRHWHVSTTCHGIHIFFLIGQSIRISKCGIRCIAWSPWWCKFFQWHVKQRKMEKKEKIVRRYIHSVNTPLI